MSNVKLNQAQGTDSNWDFAGKRLEQQIGGTDFVSSESTLLLTTPRATYDDEAIRMAVAVGLVQDISFNQQRQATQIYEVGSRRKYTFSSGRTSGQMSLSRVLFDGQSLMKAVTREEQIDLVHGRRHRRVRRLLRQPRRESLFEARRADHGFSRPGQPEHRRPLLSRGVHDLSPDGH
jgi:hypothetical protein